MSSSATLMETEEGFTPVFFEPQPLRNLALIDDVESLCPMTDMKVKFTFGFCWGIICNGVALPH